MIKYTISSYGTAGIATDEREVEYWKTEVIAFVVDFYF